jgi:integrase
MFRACPVLAQDAGQAPAPNPFPAPVERPTMADKLKKSVVDDAKPKAKRYILWDGELRGFGVRITPAGAKSYICQYRLHGRAGKTQTVTIGAHGTLTPDQARKLAFGVLSSIKQGEDPAADKRRQKQEAGTATSIAGLGEEFLDVYVSKKKPRTLKEYRKLIENVIAPGLGKLTVAGMTYGDVESWHHRLAGTPASANRSLAVLSKMMSWAIQRGARPDRQNPCKGINRYKENKKQRFLRESELSALGAAIREAETTGVAWEIDRTVPTSKHLPKNADNRRTVLCPFAAAAIRLIIFTGARHQEILQLQWDHVDLAAGVLRLPDSKTGAKTIALNPPAMAILAGLPRLADNPHVIPGDVPGAPRVDLNKPWSNVCKLAKLTDVRIHDLRHTLASHGQAAGLTLSLVGGLLGHKNTATTAGYAHLWDDPLKDAAHRVGARIANALDGPPPTTAEPVPIRKAGR